MTREIDLSVEVPGTPDEVWDAIATGPGIGSWFVPHTVDGRVGGTATAIFGDLGGYDSTVTAWEPPTRFAYTSEGDRPLGFEWLVEAKDGGTCIVRLINSGFGDGEDWDGDYDGMSGGWKIFLENLRLQLTHFRGRHATASVPMAMVPGPHEAAWKTLCDALGISPDLDAGDRIDGAVPLSGTIDSTIRQHNVTEYLVLLDGPVPGTAFLTTEGTGDEIGASAYLYLHGDDAPAAAQRWKDWFQLALAREAE